MRMRVLTTKLRVEIENEMRVFLDSLNFEIEMRVSQKSEMLSWRLRNFQRLNAASQQTIFIVSGSLFIQC